MPESKSVIPEMVRQHEAALLQGWMQAQLDAITLRPDLLQEDDLREQSRSFSNAVRTAPETSDGSVEPSGPGWPEARALLAGIPRTRARRGFSVSETATCAPRA